MISRIFVKKITKSYFNKKDSFTIVDVAPKDYYKLPVIDKLYFTKNIMGFNKVLENIRPHDSIENILPDGTVCQCMIGNEFVYSLANLIQRWENMWWVENNTIINENAKYEKILMQIIKKAQKINGNYSRVIFVMEKS